MTPRELKDRMDRDEKITVLDVREPSETRIANIGGLLIPMGEIPQRLDELPKDAEIVVLCHHGIRSAQVTSYLRQNGFTNASNLAGGIERWSLEIDPSVPRY